MRKAKAIDFWKKISSLKYTNYIDSITFTECNGFSDTVKLEPGITVICGLNGVGKSSIISSIAKLLGIEDDSSIRKSKFHGEIKAKLSIHNTITDISEESTAIENGLESELIRYIDSDLAIECIKYWNQDNIDDLITQEEPYTYKEEQIKNINQIIGKKYTECTIYEIEDSGEKFIPVYFKVKTEDTEYGSQGMGIGEHFLLYLYHMLSQQVKENSIVIIEEPESYISIHSQKKLLDFIAKTIVTKKLSVILTTHSPFILSQVKTDNIRIITNIFGKMQIQTPSLSDTTDKLLGMEYRIYEKIVNNEDKIATLFVEDYAARLFLSCILKNRTHELYDKIDIVSLNGESDITTILQFDIGEFMSHKLIGVYDGDMISKVSQEKIDKKCKLPYCFLPIDECVEIEIQNFINLENTYKSLQKVLNIEISHFNSIIEALSYEDHHDWFIELCKNVDKTQQELIEVFYNVWSQDNEEKINNFVNDIKSKVLTKNKVLINS